MEYTISLKVVLILLMAALPTFEQFFIDDSLFEGNPCTVNKTTKGICTSAMICPQSKKMIQSHRRHNLPRCNWKGAEEIVCCPQETVDRVGTKSRTQLACEKYSNERNITILNYIFGGEDATLGDFPHMAAIGYLMNGNITYSCGGALISEKFVLTAAHCVVTQSGVLPTVVRLGNVDISGNAEVPGTEYEIETSIIHPDYAPPQRYNDIALLLLLTNVTFGEYVMPCCVFNSNDLPLVPIPIATGWGDTTITQSNPSTILQQAQLPFVNITHCNSSYEDDSRRLPRGIVSTMVCAGTGTGTADTCRGDSGGPLQMELKPYSIWTIVGVTSFGVGCGGNAVPGVYTRVSSYTKWIEDTVWPIT